MFDAEIVGVAYGAWKAWQFSEFLDCDEEVRHILVFCHVYAALHSAAIVPSQGRFYSGHMLAKFL